MTHIGKNGRRGNTDSKQIEIAGFETDLLFLGLAVILRSLSKKWDS